ncbi:hypothetical protein D3C76_1218950 [compost metagenome]
MGVGPGQALVAVDVGLVGVPYRRRLVFEVGILQLQPVLMVFVHGHQHRVAIAQEQPTARLEQGRHGAGPGLDARKPAQCTDTGVDQVESTRRQHAVSLVDVGMHVVDCRAAALGKTPGLQQRGCGIVQAADLSPQPRQRQGVGTDMALQMGRAQAVNVTQPRQVETHGFGQVLGLADQALDFIIL